MKQIALLLCCASLTAHEMLVPEEGYPILEERPFSPFSVSGTSLQVTNAHFREEALADQHIRYAQNNIALGYIQPFNEIWGIIFGAGYVGTQVKWDQNPAFTETQFGYVNFSLGAFTNAMPNWAWTLTLTGYIDTAVLDLSDYALYQGVLYGEYEFCDSFSFDAGFILEWGLNHGKAWPIFGFSWEPEDYRWRIHAIYPLDVSIEYDLWPDFIRLAVSARFLRDRHRVSEIEPTPMGIYQYNATGAEFDLILSPRKWFIIKGFAGSTFGGDLKVADRSNHDALHFKFKHALYYGINMILTF